MILALGKHNRTVPLFVITFSLLWAHCTVAEVIGFLETFDGEGRFQTIGGQLDGLDNPDWSFDSTGGEARLQNGGLTFEHVDDGLGVESILKRQVVGEGSFVERIEFRDLDFGTATIEEPPFARSFLSVTHTIGPERSLENWASITLSLPSVLSVDVFVMAVRHSRTRDFHDVPIGENIALEIEFDDVLAALTFRYDDDTLDQVAPMQFGPYSYTGVVSEEQITTMNISSGGSLDRKANGILDHWSQQELTFPGDYDDDHLLTVADVDLLMTRIREGPFSKSYDLNNDGVLSSADARTWAEDLKGTWLGDANLDGEFNSTDLVAVFQAGEYDEAL